MLLFESGSGKFIKLDPQGYVRFHSDPHDGTPIRADRVEQVIQEYQLEYLRHTLEPSQYDRGRRVHITGILGNPVEDRSVRDHVRSVLRKITG